ncbi:MULTISPECIES: hypothetical protein [Kitasatospora]|uniref:Transposase n=1 Tax=Kitasatospora cathayae TaxID=3004092 RepID=A0ABY7QFD0_9ACTN|nr:hypothetical protein [Kitasatospora sp. HUAS 3-15]WBP91327.1 hypothetical protein O1G21_39225 [Kitasatospora sp. HUAS 3-15]
MAAAATVVAAHAPARRGPRRGKLTERQTALVEALRAVERAGS